MGKFRDYLELNEASDWKKALKIIKDFKGECDGVEPEPSNVVFKISDIDGFIAEIEDNTSYNAYFIKGAGGVVISPYSESKLENMLGW